MCHVDAWEGGFAESFSPPPKARINRGALVKSKEVWIKIIRVCFYTLEHLRAVLVQRA